MKKTALLTFSLLVFAGGLSAELTSAEKTFITKAAKGNLAEVELGKLASEKSHNQQIKDFGQQMVTDHSKANDNLKPIADSNDVQWSTKLTGEPKALYDKLSTLSGAAFDKTYVNAMVEDHQKDAKRIRGGIWEGEGLAAQVVRRSDITRSPAAPKPYPVDTAVFR